MENIQSTLENILSKYKQKSVEIDIQTKDGASIDDWKTQCKLRRDLYKEYCNEVFHNSSGFYNPINYTSFFILLDNQQGYFT